jgi:hypothetical protein
VQVVDARAAPLADARLDDRGLAVDHGAQDLDLVLAARGGDAVGGHVVLDAQPRAVAGALDHRRRVELGPHRLPVVAGEPAPQALGGVHGISTTILPSLAPAVKRS